MIHKPYVIISEHERDHIMRMIMNLAHIKVQHGADQAGSC